MITTLILLASIIILDLVIIGVDVLVLTIMLTLIAYKYERHPKYDVAFFMLILILAILSLFIDIEYIRSGLIGFGCLNVVLFTGVLPDKWGITKKLKSYRAFYSIIGFIAIIPHASLNLFVDQQIDVFGIAAIVIMIPLFITSFNVVKKEMKAQEWIKLQKVSYIVYVALFIHLIYEAPVYGKVIYAILMTLYVNNKLLKEYKK